MLFYDSIKVLFCLKYETCYEKRILMCVGLIFRSASSWLGLVCILDQKIDRNKGKKSNNNNKREMIEIRRLREMRLHFNRQFTCVWLGSAPYYYKGRSWKNYRQCEWIKVFVSQFIRLHFSRSFLMRHTPPRLAVRTRVRWWYDFVWNNKTNTGNLSNVFLGFMIFFLQALYVGSLWQYNACLK